MVIHTQIRYNAESGTRTNYTNNSDSEHDSGNLKNFGNVIVESLGDELILKFWGTPVNMGKWQGFKEFSELLGTNLEILRVLGWYIWNFEHVWALLWFRPGSRLQFRFPKVNALGLGLRIKFVLN